MSINKALIERFDRDLFKSELPEVSEELQRRLNILVEDLYDILMELKGTQLVNNNVVYYVGGAPDVNIPNGRTVTVNGLNDSGETVSLVFSGGILQA